MVGFGPVFPETMARKRREKVQKTAFHEVLNTEHNMVESVGRRRRAGFGRTEGGVEPEPADLGTESPGHAEEVFGGQTLELALGQDVFDALQLAGQRTQFRLMGGEDPVLQGLDFKVAKVGNLGAMLTLPFNGSAFGDLEFGGDTREGPAFGAQFDEPVVRFDWMHATDEQRWAVIHIHMTH